MNFSHCCLCQGHHYLHLGELLLASHNRTKAKGHRGKGCLQIKGRFMATAVVAVLITRHCEWVWTFFMKWGILGLYGWRQKGAAHAAHLLLGRYWCALFTSVCQQTPLFDMRLAIKWSILTATRYIVNGQPFKCHLRVCWELSQKFVIVLHAEKLITQKNESTLRHWCCKSHMWAAAGAKLEKLWLKRSYTGKNVDIQML